MKRPSLQSSLQSRRIWLWLASGAGLLLIPVALTAPRPTAVGAGSFSVSRKSVSTSTSMRNTSLYAGDVVRTSTSGGTLQFEDGSRVSMAPNSSIELTEGNGKTAFRALKGRMVARLRPGKTVETRTALVRVRGTEIHLAVDDDDTTTLAVLEGEAELSNDKGLVMVGTGQQSVARPGSAPTLPITIQNPGLMLEWTLQLERVVLPRETVFTGLRGTELNNEIARRRTAAEAAPQDAAAQAALGEALFDARQFEAALEAFAKAKAAAPTNGEVAARLGQTLLELGQVGEAETAFQAALNSAPAQALTGLAELELARDRPREAQSYAERALVAAPESGRAGIALGVALMRQPGALERAAAALQNAATAQPEALRYQAQAWLSLVYLAQDDMVAAQKAAQAAVQAAPDSGLARGNLSLVQFFSGNAREAQREAQRAVALNPDSVAARVALGQAFLARGDADTAQTEATTAVALDPRLPQARYLLGVADAGRRDYAHAERELKEALRLAPDFLPAAAALARVYNAMGERSAAEKTVRTLLGRAPNSDEIRAALGQVFYQQGRFDEAVNEYREAVRRRPNSALYLAELARALLDANHLNEAIQIGQKAVALAPQVAQYHALLGQIYSFSEGGSRAAGGFQANAEREFRTALTLDPQNALARVRLATRSSDADANIGLNSIAQSFLYDPAIVEQLARGGIDSQVDANFSDGGDREYTLRHKDRALDGRFHTFTGFTRSTEDSHGANTKDRQNVLGTYNVLSPDPRTNIFAGLIDFHEGKGLPGPTLFPDPDDFSRSKLSRPVLAARRRMSAGNHVWLGIAYDTFQGRNQVPSLPSSFVPVSPFDAAYRSILAPGITIATVGQDVMQRQPQPEIRADLTLGRDSSRPTLLTVGAGYGRSHLRVSEPNLFFVDPRGGIVDVGSGVTNGVVRTSLAYAQASRNINDRLSLIGQLRVQKRNDNEQSTLFVGGQSFLSAPSINRQTSLLPSIVTTYQAGKRTSLRFFANRRRFDLANFTFAPTEPLLTAETSVLPRIDNFGDADIYQFDVERYNERGFAKLFAFHSKTRNADIGSRAPSIAYAIRSDFYAVNFDQLNRTGVGARLERRLGGRIFGSGLLLASKTTAIAAGERFDHQDAPYQPKLQGVIGVQYIDPHGKKAGLFVRHEAAFFQDSPLFELNNPGAPRPRFPARTLVDFRLGQEPSVREEYFIAVTNLFNRPVLNYADFPTEGRRIMVGFSYRW